MSEELDQVFVGLVNQSWKHYNEELQNTRMDDLLISAVIALTVEQGYSANCFKFGRHESLLAV